MEGRAAIAIDLSPAATFITKNYCTPVDVDELQRAFEELQAAVKPEMDWLYETRCDRCDGRAITAYTVYSQVFQCPRCLERIPLFDCVEVESQTAAGKPKTINVCPYCFQRGHIEHIRSQSEKFGAIPVMVNYECAEGCKPKRGERRYNDPDPKKRRFFAEYDLVKIREIDAKPIPHRYPQGYDMTGFSRYQRDALRLYGVREVADLFTKRNLSALAALNGAAEQDHLRLAVSSIVLNSSRLYRNRYVGGGGPAGGTFYLPQDSREIAVLPQLEEKVKEYLTLDSEIRDPQVIVSTQTAIDLESISPMSIDYIFTDPPYADKVQYGELNFVWEAWLDFDTHWHDQEIIVNKTRGMTEDDWARLMRRAITECYRVLKPGRWISLCYHDTSEGTWQLVQDIMAEAGFVAEGGSGEALYIDTGQKSYNQLMADKVTKRDLVINFRKPRFGEVAPALGITGDEDDATFAEKARAILIDVLEAHPGAAADRLYDELVSRMVRRGEFERHNFEALLAQVAEPVVVAQDGILRHNARWYLKETADRVDEAESAREAAAAARLEAFMRSQTFEVSETSKVYEGTHYSDLFEQYLGVKDKPRRLLADWLPEFFYKTSEGTWRPPAEDEERAAKAALRTTGILRKIKRFANALIEGAPPSDGDRPANAATAADWIRQCRRAGLHELGRALYEKGGFDFGTLGDQGQVEVQEDYQLCVRRSG